MEENIKVSFPDTAYSLPCIYAATGKKMNCLGELEGALDIIELINKTHLLEHALNSGLATALAAEVIEAINMQLVMLHIVSLATLPHN